MRIDFTLHKNGPWKNYQLPLDDAVIKSIEHEIIAGEEVFTSGWECEESVFNYLLKQVNDVGFANRLAKTDRDELLGEYYLDRNMDDFHLMETLPDNYDDYDARDILEKLVNSKHLFSLSDDFYRASNKDGLLESYSKQKKEEMEKDYLYESVLQNILLPFELYKLASKYLPAVESYGCLTKPNGEGLVTTICTRDLELMLAEAHGKGQLEAECEE